MNVKFGALNGLQQSLFRGIEEAEAAKINTLLNLGAG